MAITYVGGTTASGSNSANILNLTALTGGIASAPSLGDFVLVVTGFTSIAQENPGVSNSGYTQLALLWADDTFDTNLWAGWKIMGPTPDTSITCNPSSAATRGAVSVCHVWRGVNYLNPIDVTTVTRTLTNNSNPGCLAITPRTPGAVVIEAGLGSNADAETITQTPVLGFSNFLTVTTDPGTACTAEIDSYSGWTSGSITPDGWAGFHTTSSNSSCGVTIALRPENNIGFIVRKLRPRIFGPGLAR